MSDGIVIVNKGDEDTRLCIRWAKTVSEGCRIVSMVLENDPYVDANNALTIATEEGVAHEVLPFVAEYIATKNQNVEKAWEFERHMKAMQHARALHMMNDSEELTFLYALSPLRYSEFNVQLHAILERFIKLHHVKFPNNQVFRVRFSTPLLNIASEEDLNNFKIEHNL